MGVLSRSKSTAGAGAARPALRSGASMAYLGSSALTETPAEEASEATAARINCQGGERRTRPPPRARRQQTPPCSARWTTAVRGSRRCRCRPGCRRVMAGMGQSNHKPEVTRRRGPASSMEQRALKHVHADEPVDRDAVPAGGSAYVTGEVGRRARSAAGGQRRVTGT